MGETCNLTAVLLSQPFSNIFLSQIEKKNNNIKMKRYTLLNFCKKSNSKNYVALYVLDLYIHIAQAM